MDEITLNGSITSNGSIASARRTVKRTITRVERAEITLSRNQLERILADTLGMRNDATFYWSVNTTDDSLESLNVVQENETAMETPSAG